MALTGALFTGVSGLNAQAQSMGTISDNIANVNTTGYKRTATKFSTLVTDSGSPTTYSPGGVRSRPTALIDQQGQISTTESDTDLAISGNGFFVVNIESDSRGEPLYTRAGSFSPDATGKLQNSAGYYLQGWPLDADGAIVGSFADLSSLETVNVQSLRGVAAATTSVEIGTNVDASQAAYTGAYAAGDLAAGTVTPHFFREFEVFDALGATHKLTTGFLKTGTNSWAVEVYAADPNDLAASTSNPIASGVVMFNGDGSLDADDAAVTIGTLDPDTGALETSLAIDWANGAASSAIDLNWGTNDSNDGLTQFDSEFNVVFVNQNGAAVGLLDGVTIDEDGFVIAAFTNGESQRLYKVPIATFADPTSLSPRDGNAYVETALSGSHNLREAGTGGAGLVVSGGLESSNVDLAQEFTDMIITQRAYSANTRVITTVDEMLDELIRLRR